MFKSIPAAEKIKISLAIIGFLVAAAGYTYRMEQFAAMAAGTQEALASTQSDIVELRSVAASNVANIDRVSRSLEKTGELLDRLILRMGDHEVESAKRASQADANTAEINRLRDGR